MTITLTMTTIRMGMHCGAKVFVIVIVFVAPSAHRAPRGAIYAIASDEMRFSENSAERSLLSRSRFGNGLRHRLRRDALQREVLGDLLLECRIGTEHDLVALDHGRG